MFYRILFVLAVALACCIPCDAYAGPLGIFPNFHPVQKLARGVGKAAKAAGQVAKGTVRAARPRARACN